MNCNKKAEARATGIGFDLKTNNLTGGQNKAFSYSDYTSDLESVQSILDRMIKAGKTIRCYRCFACNRYFPASRMASALVVCRDCLKRTQAKGRLARLNVIDRITNDFRIFLRGRLEAK